MSQSEIDYAIDKTLYSDFDRVLYIYRKAIGQERFNKLIEKHRSQADPQDRGEGKSSTERQKRNVKSEEMKIKAYGDIKEMCLEVGPTDIKIKETSEGVKIIMEK